MKNNKNKLSVIKNFQEGMRIAMENYYRQAIPENVKRALKNKKKLSTL